MKEITLSLPAMYGDHHVAEVRRILLALPGVKDAYASSCFQSAQVTYDPAQIEEDAIKAALDEAGYLQELPLPVETGQAAYGRSGGDTYFRHTAAYVQTQQVVSFGQQVQSSSRPLWPCPGIGPIRNAHMDE